MSLEGERKIKLHSALTAGPRSIMTVVGIDHSPLFTFFFPSCSLIFGIFISPNNANTQVRREKVPVINMCVCSVDAGDH